VHLANLLGGNSRNIRNFKNTVYIDSSAFLWYN